MRPLSYLSIKVPVYFAYMAQQVEYEPRKLMDWLKRMPQLTRVMHRQKLVLTKKASALVIFQYLAVLVYAALIGIICASLSLGFVVFILLFPLASLIALVSAIYAGQIISLPFDTMLIRRSRKIFAAHKGLKIVILGSYGKTSMKELLLETFEGNRKVKATPGNKNVPISHARWASRLNGDEEILLIELGEAKPGDIAGFCRNISPDMAILTGVAPNHLDKYRTLDNLADDLSSIKEYVTQDRIYVNYDAESLFAKNRLDKKKVRLFGVSGSSGVSIKDVKVSLTGMSLTAVSDKKNMKLMTGMVGKHLIGPISVCLSLALEIGLSEGEIKKAIRTTKPFEHRLQPKEIGGAWIIDDTYNGSLEGFRAGLELLKELKAKRKIYVTPGLVDQGEETENVHKEIGRLIAKCAPDRVVLINNSVTSYIKDSLEGSGYKGEIDLRDDPLEFYTNLEHMLAAGDIALLQNDWTDNYA
ncbi:MAG TPA: Mur ligase family protein [Candidatus Saccharimonadales bacterium]|nr:Mur ligase family protein [Candidatus Saccharimonadales bacterium]